MSLFYIHAPAALFLFYLVNLAIFGILFKINSEKKYRFNYEIGQLQEKLNILSEEERREFKNNADLQTKILRYNSLKKVVEGINEELDLDSVAEHLCSIAFSLVSNNKGTCLLYLVNKEAQKLVLFKSKKEESGLVIKAKEGNIFDSWVLRHSSPLMIEDVRRDFRFDLEKLKAQDPRPIASIISVPFISEHRVLGVLRLDNARPDFYTQDDLRFLATVSDLGAVALENSQLFQKTQDLAIHDSLTSLYTKGYFMERLKEECRRARRNNAVFSLLMLDIDFFKNYNDKFGHTAGDIVLKKLSGVISDHLADPSAIICRFGGEEFCVLIFGADRNKALTIADSLRKRIEKEKIVLRREETGITVSIGVSAYPASSSDETELIQKADKAMYEAKQKGRNKVCSI